MRKAFVIVLVIAMFAMVANASVFSTNLVEDNFDSLNLGEYWYVLNWDGDQVTQGYYGGASSVTAEDGSLVLAVYPDSTPGDYSNAELAERLTGQSAELPGKWSPSPGHPVVFEVRARWSSQYADNSAVGTSGFWLWNSPITGLGYGDTEAFGFSWSMLGTGYNMAGLKASIIRGFPPHPVFSAPVQIDVTEWNVFKVVWAVGPGGNEVLTFFVNDIQIGHQAITPTMGSLTVEVWNDNQLAGPAGLSYPNPSSTQMMFLDYIKVEKQ